MSLIFLPAGSSHTVGASGESIFGVGSGSETVRIPNDSLSGFFIDANVDRIEFPLPVASYKLEAWGTAVKVYMGATLIATVGVKTSDANGTRLVFADGSALTQLSALDSSVIGGVSVPQTTGGGEVAPTLTAGDTSTSTISGSSFTLTGGNDTLSGSNAADTFTAPDGTLSSADQIDGSAGADTLNVQGDSIIASGSLDQVSNIETIAFSNTTANIVLVTVEALVASGKSLSVSAPNLALGTMSFNGSAETDGGRFEISGGHLGDTLIGGTGNDGLFGMSGDDSLVGGDGDDKLMGGLGSDTLVGGLGADTYGFVATNDGSDLIAAAEFVSGTDKLSFNSTAFNIASLTAAADTAFSTDITTTLTSLGTTSDSSFYRAALTGANFGTALYDVLDAAMTTGAHTGAALFAVSNGTDTVLLYDPDTDATAAGSVVELVKLAGATAYAAIDINDLILFSSTRFFALTTGNDSFTGTAFADTFHTTQATLNTSDTLIGGDGTDTLNLDGAASLTIDSTITGIENLVLGHTGQTIAFTPSASSFSNIVGGTSVDIIDITHLAASTSVYLENGNDTLTLAALVYTGVLDGGNGTDTLALANGSNISGASVASFGEATLSGSATMTLAQHNGFGTSLTGAGGSDVITLTTSGTLTGGSCVEGYVLSGTGAYVFTNGYTGAVSVTGGTGGDTFNFASGELGQADTIIGNSGTDILNVTGNTAITTSDLDHVTGIEFIHFSNGTSNIALTTVDDLVASGATLDLNASGLSTGTLSFNGSNESDGNLYVFGGDGGNTIIGGSGNDMLGGGSAPDTLEGGDGDDIFEANVAKLSAGDSLNGGNGTDTLFLTTGGGLVTIGSGHTLTNIEKLILDDSPNLISFDASASGISSIEGGTSADTVNLANLGLTVAVNLGDDADTLKFSGTYTGTLNGGAGTDVLSAEANANITAATISNFETLQIGSYQTVTMTLTQHNTGFTSILGNDSLGGITLTTHGTITGGASIKTYTLSSTGPNDFTSAYVSGGVIIGGSDSDTITGGNGDDTITGGNGADTFRYTSAAQSNANLDGEIDTITDLVLNGASGDLIDLPAVTGSLTVSTVAASGSLTGANSVAELHALYNSSTGTASTTFTGGSNATALLATYASDSKKQLIIDIDGDGAFTTADIAIEVTGVTATSFTDQCFV